MIFKIIIVLVLLIILFVRKTEFMNEPHFAELYCGNTGSGKSSTIACLSNKFINNGWSACYCTAECKGTILIDPWELETKRPLPHSVIFIDEIGIIFNSRNWKNFGQRKGLIEFFKKCRHYKVRIIAFSQTWDDSDKIIRELFSRITIIKRTLRLWSFQRPVAKRMDIYNTSSADTDKKQNNGGQIADFFKYKGFPRLVFLPRWFSYFDSYDVDETRELITGRYIALDESSTNAKHWLDYYGGKIKQYFRNIPKRIKNAFCNAKYTIKDKILSVKQKMRETARKDNE